MRQPVPLPVSLYRQVKELKKGESLTLTIHGDFKDGSTCEVIAPGHKPIKCRSQRTFRRGKHGGNAKGFEIVLSRL